MSPRPWWPLCCSRRPPAAPRRTAGQGPRRAPTTRAPTPRRGSSATSPTGASTAATTRSKSVETSGSAAELTDLVYAFGQVERRPVRAPPTAWADYQQPIAAADSVDGAADPDGRPAAGQLRPAPQAQGAASRAEADLVVRRLERLGRLHRRGPRSGRLRRVVPRSAHRPPLAGPVRRHRHRLGVPQRLRRDLRLQRHGRRSPGLLDALRSAFGPDALVTAAVPGRHRQVDRDRLRRGGPLGGLAQRDDLRLLRHRRGRGPATTRATCTAPSRIRR